MSWIEFFNLVNGLLPESPLGQVVSIRAEKDPERLKGFNKDQHEIKNSWRRKIDERITKNMSKKDKEVATKEIQMMFKQMFGKEG
jgi:Bacteriophage Gp15 protein.